MRDLCGDGLTIRLPETWNSVGENGPYGVSPLDGAGYLQFCVAFGAGDSNRGEAMLDVVLTMARGYQMGEPREIVSEDDPLPLGAASFSKDGEFCRMWELKQGNNLVSAIFVCQQADRDNHLEECESIVRSIRTGERSTTHPA
jgi:hypothetical protein